MMANYMHTPFVYNPQRDAWKAIRGFYVSVQGVKREGDRGRQAISSLLTPIRSLPERPHAMAHATWGNFSRSLVRFLVYSWCFSRLHSTSANMASPWHS
jgi:hypothetical protein